MNNIPSTSTLRALANQSLEEQNNVINALQIHRMRKNEFEELELRMVLLNDSDFKSRIVKLLAQRQKQLYGSYLKEQDFYDRIYWKTYYALAVVIILVFVLYINPNTITETTTTYHYQGETLKSVTIKTERQVWSTSTWIRVGFVVCSAIALCIWLLSDGSITKIKDEKVISEQNHELKTE